MERTIREQLEELAEEKYRIFSSSLTPGKNNILGVRLPLLRKMAAKIVKGDWRRYLAEAMDSSIDESMEEVMLQGMVIGSCGADFAEVLELAKSFIPKIDCWSICDCFCSDLKIARKKPSLVWEFIQPYLTSDKEYEIRFGLVMLLHFIKPEYAPKAFEHFDRIHHEGYYVKMAVAWVLSMYYVHLPELTFVYLNNNHLDHFTYNKALQKIMESLRVDKETKEIIKRMKRKPLNNH